MSASAQDVKPSYIKVTQEYKYPGTNLTSTAGMVEKVIAEEKNTYILQAPKGKLVRIPKSITKRITAEDAASLLISEREYLIEAVEQYGAEVSKQLKKIDSERNAAIQLLIEKNKNQPKQLKNTKLTVPAPAQVIQAQIKGEFTGWEGETLFQLTNGQIWQQSIYAYTYHYAYQPKVIIYATKTGFAMKVDGVSSSINVKRIK